MALAVLPLIPGVAFTRNAGVGGGLTFSKSGPGQVAGGGTITYTIVVSNASGGGPSQPIDVTDQVAGVLTNVQASSTRGNCNVTPGNLVDCRVGILQAGQSATITITATAPSGSCPLIPNTAFVKAGTGQPQPTNTVTTQVTGCEPDVTFSKSGPATVSAGGQVTYTIAVSNNGDAASQPITVTDDLSDLYSNVNASSTVGTCSVGAGNLVTCNVGVLGAGDDATITITATAPSATCPEITNVASVQEGEQPPENTNTVDTQVTGCEEGPDVTITKSASATSVEPGDTFTFTVVVTSIGDSPAQSVVVTDTIASGLTIQSVSPTPQCGFVGQAVTCNLGDLAPGASATITITVTATEDACPSVVNSAHVSFAGGDGGSADSNPVTVDVDCGEDPDLEIVKDSDAPAGGVEEDDSFGYTITVTNTGAGTANDVVVTDTIPDGLEIDSVDGPGCSVAGQTVTCDVGDLAPGASVDITITVTAREGACPSVDNSATVSWSDDSGSHEEDSNTVETDVDCVGGETVTPTPPPPPTTTPPGGTAFTGPDDDTLRLGLLAIGLLVIGTGLMFAGYRRRARYEDRV
jgi:uncharacterized repeat protein (TIGR01451 family)